MAEQSLGALIAYIGADVSRLQRAVQNAEKLLKQYEANAGQTLSKVEKGWVKSFENINKTINKATSTIQKPLKNLSQSLFSVKGLLISFGTYKFAKSFIDVASGVEMATVKLDVLTGKGKETFEDIIKVARNTITPVEDVTEAFVKFKAYGIDPTAESMTAILSAAKVLGGVRGTGVRQFAMALGQIVAKGYVSSEELNQLADAGYNARKVLRETFQLTTKDMGNLARAFRERGVDVREVVDVIIEDMKKKFGDLAERIRDTWEGLIFRLKLIWWEFRRAIMESGPFQALKNQLEDLVRYFESAEGKIKLQAWAETVGNALTLLVNVVAKAARFIKQHIDTIISAFISLKVANIGGNIGSILGAGIGGLIGLVGGPVGAAGGAALGASLGKMVGWLSSLLTSFQVSNDIIRKILNEVSFYTKSETQLRDDLQTLYEKRKETLKELENLAYVNEKEVLLGGLLGIRGGLAGRQAQKLGLQQQLATYEAEIKKYIERINKLEDQREITKGGPGAGTGGEGKEPPEIDEAALKKQEQMIQQFYNSYNQLIMSNYEYQIWLLDQEYKEFAKYIKNKEELERWYNLSRAKIYEETTGRIIDRFNEEVKALSMTPFELEYDKIMSKAAEFVKQGIPYEQVASKFIAPSLKKLSESIDLTPIQKEIQNVNNEMLKMNPTFDEATKKIIDFAIANNMLGNELKIIPTSLLKANESAIIFGNTALVMSDNIEMLYEKYKQLYELMEEQSKVQMAKDLIEQYTDSTIKMNRELERVNNLRPILIELLGSEIEADRILAEAMKDIKEQYSGLGDLVKELDWAFQSAFENAIIEGENLRSVLAGLLEDIAKIILRLYVTQPLAKSIVGGIGAMFGMHEGGIVGKNASFMRLVPESTFINAPRLHKGLAPDEFPAILQKGEIVLPKNFGQNNVEVQPNIRIINVLDPSIVGNYLATPDGEKVIVNVMQKNIRRLT